MSFAKEVKKEILEHDIQDSQEVLAFMSSLFRACGNLNRNSEGLSAELVTDSRDLFSFVDKLTKRLYGENLKLGLSDDHIINKTIYYRISFPSSISLSILTDCGGGAPLTLRGRALGAAAPYGLCCVSRSLENPQSWNRRSTETQKVTASSKTTRPMA